MDEEDDISMYQPTWQEAPLPFQSNEPVATPQIHGIADDAWLDADTDSEDEPPLSPIVRLEGPHPPPPTTTLAPTTTTLAPTTTTTLHPTTTTLHPTTTTTHHPTTPPPTTTTTPHP